MDKQKQIEEMIDIQRKNCLGKGVGDCVDADCNACSALAFYNAGYRKIPEGAVVLTREEYEKLQALKEDYVKGYEAGVDEGWENARKETAEKFAEKARVKAIKARVNIDNNPRNESFIFLSDIDEIAKEIK